MLASNDILQHHLAQRGYLNTLQAESVSLQRAQVLHNQLYTSRPDAIQANRQDTDRIIHAIHKLAERPEWRLTEHGLRLFTRQDGHVTEQHVNSRYKRNG